MTKSRELYGQQYVTGYETSGDTLAEALALSIPIIARHEALFHMVRVDNHWDSETDQHYVYLTVLA